MNFTNPKLLLFFLLIINLVANGQDLNDFTTLKARVPVPEDFTKLSSVKYEEDYNANTDLNLDKDFFLNSRFFIDELLLSGKVLFNNELTDYVNRVAKYILHSKPKLVKELRFYVLKSNVVNAFSTDQGIIFITTGLLSHLENEAQLAFVIAHEVSHYTENHVRESYVEQQQIETGTGKYERTTYETKIARLSQYSKDNELEADKKGIDLYLHSEYRVDEIFGAFGALLYSYLPIEEIRFDTNFFNTEFLKIPGGKFDVEVKEITKEEDYDDEESTHPNIKKRMDAALEVIGEKSSKGDLKYKISEDEFNRVRDLARFEELNLLLAERSYGKVLYSVQVLRKSYPENRFLDLCEVKAMYGLVKYKNNSRYSEVIVKYKNSEGEISVLDNFLENITKPELNIIAYRLAYDYSQKHGGDDSFDLYEEELLKELATHSGLKFNKLQPFTFEEYVERFNSEASFDIEDSIARVDASDLSKYDKIKLKKKLRELEVDSDEILDENADYYLFALCDLVSKKNLREKLEDAKKEANESGNNSYNYQWSSSVRRYGYSLGVDKVVIVDPIFESYGVDDQRKHLKSEDYKIELGKMYARDYKKIHMERTTLDSKQMDVNDAEKYNSIGTLFLWVMEVIEHEDLDMIASQHDQMQELVKKYGTSHFLFTGIYASREPKIFWPRSYTEITAFSIDAETDKIEFRQINHIWMKPKRRNLEPYVFGILYQLNRKPKN